MRSIKLWLMLLCGLAFSGWAQAQTWSHPLIFDTNTYVSQEDTCSKPPEQLIIDDFGYVIQGPVVVYRAVHTVPFFSKANRPWRVQVLPQFGFEDFSVWVCANHVGTHLSTCQDGSDNGPGMTNTVMVPGLYPTSWYVVVAGNIYGQTPTCGPFTLIATKL